MQIFPYNIGNNKGKNYMDIEPRALIASVKARPFNTTFNRQIKSAQELYGKQLSMQKLSRRELEAELGPMLAYYAKRDSGYILDRVCQCILTRQKLL